MMLEHPNWRYIVHRFQRQETFVSFGCFLLHFSTLTTRRNGKLYKHGMQEKIKYAITEGEMIRFLGVIVVDDAV
jgi:hypothetical protein